MKYLRRFLWIIALGTPLAYVGSYLLTVEAAVEQFAHNQKPVPHYAFGGKFAEQLYMPAHWVDTQVRTSYWQAR